MGLLTYLYKKTLILFCFAIVSPLCFAQNEENTEYERSSIHIMMIKHLNQRFDDVIEDVFLKSPFPNRFNDHNLGVKVVSFAETRDDQTSNIASFIDQVNLGQKMVSKWFNRDKITGSFNMELVKERGFYNASQSEINEARAFIQGKALLEDAGEFLIHNTYLLVNDISYKSRGSRDSFFKALAGAYFNKDELLTSSLFGIGGFKVNLTSYLFRLVWNDDIANEFYANHYTEDGASESNKVKAFKNERQLFKLEFIGKSDSESKEIQFAESKDPRALLIKIVTRAMDENIAKLQQSYADFRIKAPLIGTEPLMAYVGLKENITEKSKFEVLERVLTKEGKIKYERVGIIRPVKGKIADNRYMAYEDDPSGITATEFEKIFGKDFSIGMFIREIEH